MDARLSQIADKLMKFRSAEDVHPRAIGAALLPHLFILGIENHNHAARLRVRLTGTSLQQFSDAACLAITWKTSYTVRGPQTSSQDSTRLPCPTRRSGCANSFR